MDQLVRTVDQEAPTAEHKRITVDRARRSVRMWHWLKRHVVFVITVLVPTLAATIYYGLLASGV